MTFALFDCLLFTWPQRTHAEDERGTGLLNQRENGRGRLLRFFVSCGSV